MTVTGNINGIKNSILERLELLYELKIPKDEFASFELLEILAEITQQVNREISVYINRNGKILNVSIGESDKVDLPFLRIKRGNEVLSGVRCIHTHPSGNSKLSDVDIGTLMASRLDAMAALGTTNGIPQNLTCAVLGDDFSQIKSLGTFSANRLPQSLMKEILLADKRIDEFLRLKGTDEKIERAILVGVNSTRENMDELEQLCKTAGAEIIYRLIQKRDIDNRYYIGKGEAEKLSLLVSSHQADLIITDDELSPTMARNLEEKTGVKVIDRTALILDIFAGRANTKEGKLQVELAQLKYNLPRLSGVGIQLSRLGGGIGTRGPGETKIESDRRRIRRRIFELEKALKVIKNERDIRRNKRAVSGTKVVALTGYTNAGKSTLLNSLSGSDVFTEDKLFATLDTTARSVKLPNGKDAVFVDTVGFIEKLPHELVAAFRSTLEEVQFADLILNVIDITSDSYELHIDVVNDVLTTLNCSDKPILKVFNKCDSLQSLPKNNSENLFISAKQKSGLEEMLLRVQETLEKDTVEYTFKIPYDRSDILAYLQKHGEQNMINYLETAAEISGKWELKYIKKATGMLNG